MLSSYQSFSYTVAIRDKECIVSKVFSVRPRVWNGLEDFNGKRIPWGFHRMDELLEAINNIDPLQSLFSVDEIWEDFRAVNNMSSFADGVIIEWGVCKNSQDEPDMYVGHHNGFHPHDYPLTEVFVPAGWGNRVMEAVELGALHAEQKRIETGRLRKRYSTVVVLFTPQGKILKDLVSFKTLK